MNPENQSWQPLDPAAGSLPGEIESALGDGDSVSACVVILVDSEIDRDWGAQASLAVAKGWASSGRRIILADACLDGPVLHDAVGVENGEGVSDMVLYGASAQRITERVEEGLMLAPAGTPVTQVADVLEHVKWDMVIRGCREVGATLVFHVSTDTPGVEAMTKRAEGVLVLASPSKDVTAILGSGSGPLIAVLGPTNGDVSSVESDDEEGDVASVDVLPGPPDTEDEDALSVEGLPGLPEVEALPGLPDAEALPGLPEVEAPAASSTDDPPRTSDAFSIADLKGGQYDSEDSPEVGLEEDQAPPSQPDQAEIGASLDVGSTASVDDGGKSAADVESTEAGVSDVDDFAALDLEVAHTADSGVGAGVAVEASTTEERGKAVETGKVRRSGRGLARLKWRKRRELFIRVTLIALAMFAVVGGGFYAIAFSGLITVDWITPPDRTGVNSYVPAPVDFLPGLPAPQTAVMSHVLFIDSWSTMTDALAITEALRGELPDFLFFVTPLDVDGRLQFALYAGPAYSVEEADALRDPIVVVLDRGRTIPINPDDLSVREARFAFYFGEYTTAESAQGLVEALALVSIPAYSLQVAYADGTTRLRVYGGAFRDEVEADEMGHRVTDAQREMVLMPRWGTLPE